MPKKATFDELVAQAVTAPNSVERRRIAAKARQTVVQKKPKQHGALSQFTERIGKTICVELSNGKTITRIAESLGITPECIYGWIKKYPSFAETYQQARESMARSLVDQLIDESEKAEPDRAMLLKVRGGIIQWVAARLNPVEFSDSRRIELRGEVTHCHTHELAVEQKRRIAESWLISQSPDDTPGIIAETSGPALLESAGVRETADTQSREIPKRKKATAQLRTGSPDDGGRWRGH
jgi:hypothetical protein